MFDWRKKHGEVINDFLIFLNKHTKDYVLKGGTSLMLCYKLDRFSEDIDLDCAHSQQIKAIVDEFCSNRNYKYRIAKDTNTVKRFMIHYGSEEKPLKIEISYRKKYISPDDYSYINGITVYKIDEICRMKTHAYSSRDRIRDLYDLTFICNNYWEELSDNTIKSIQDCVSYKGIEQFDYLIATQSDPLIDNEKLADDFLTMYDKLGLLMEEETLVKDTLPHNKESSQKKYFIEVNQSEAEQLKNNNIEYEGKIYNPDRSVVKINFSDRDKADSILAQIRNRKGFKK